MSEQLTLARRRGHAAPPGKRRPAAIVHYRNHAFSSSAIVYVRLYERMFSDDESRAFFGRILTPDERKGVEVHFGGGAPRRFQDEDYEPMREILAGLGFFPDYEST